MSPISIINDCENYSSRKRYVRLCAICHNLLFLEPKYMSIVHWWIFASKRDRTILQQIPTNTTVIMNMFELGPISRNSLSLPKTRRIEIFPEIFFFWDLLYGLSQFKPLLNFPRPFFAVFCVFDNSCLIKIMLVRIPAVPFGYVRWRSEIKISGT